MHLRDAHSNGDLTVPQRRKHAADPTAAASAGPGNRPRGGRLGRSGRHGVIIERRVLAIQKTGAGARLIRVIGEFCQSQTVSEGTPDRPGGRVG
jgi:hypothetical protein